MGAIRLMGLQLHVGLACRDAAAVHELWPSAVQSGIDAESNSPFRESERCVGLRDHSKLDGRGLTFPCDATGHVDLDRLSERARQNYFYARAFIGREFFLPSIRALEH